MDREILNNTIETKLFLRKMRNDIVGSAENKIEYLNNKIFLSYDNFKLVYLIILLKFLIILTLKP